MSIANTKAAPQTQTTTSSSETGPYHVIKKSNSAQAIEKLDQISFLENFKGFEYGVSFITANFENRHSSQRELPLGSAGVSFSDMPLQRDPALQRPEEASAALLSNTIIQKLLIDPSLRNMSFSVKNKHGCINVEAAIANGNLRCTLSSTSEKLKRRMNNTREQIISRLGGHLRMSIELDIEE